MSEEEALWAERLLELARGTAAPSPDDAARNLASIEARFGVVGGALEPAADSDGGALTASSVRRQVSALPFAVGVGVNSSHTRFETCLVGRQSGPGQLELAVGRWADWYSSSRLGVCARAIR